MWIFTKLGFISVVAHRDEPTILLVRARSRQHIEAIHASMGVTRHRAPIRDTPEADYRYRFEVPREVFGPWLAKFAEGIDYDNFKNAVDDHGVATNNREVARGYLHGLHRVWSVMRETLLATH